MDSQNNVLNAKTACHTSQIMIMTLRITIVTI